MAALDHETFERLGEAIIGAGNRDPVSQVESLDRRELPEQLVQFTLASIIAVAVTFTRNDRSRQCDDNRRLGFGRQRFR